MVPGTPLPVFQPKTPAFLIREQEVAPVEQEEAINEPKVEEPWVQILEDSGLVEVEILSSSDSTSSTSGCDDIDSEVEQESELDGTRRPPGVRSGIINAVPDIGPSVSESVYANGELLQKKTTKCGRMTSSGFTIVQSIPDWTAKCRICFKGCRQPPKLW